MGGPGVALQPPRAGTPPRRRRRRPRHARRPAPVGGRRPHRECRSRGGAAQSGLPGRRRGRPGGGDRGQQPGHCWGARSAGRRRARRRWRVRLPRGPPTLRPAVGGRRSGASAAAVAEAADAGEAARTTRREGVCCQGGDVRGMLDRQRSERSGEFGEGRGGGGVAPRQVLGGGQRAAHHRQVTSGSLGRAPRRAVTAVPPPAPARAPGQHGQPAPTPRPASPRRTVRRVGTALGMALLFSAPRRRTTRATKAGRAARHGRPRVAAVDSCGVRASLAVRAGTAVCGTDGNTQQQS